MRFDLYSRAVGVFIALALLVSIGAAQTKRAGDASLEIVVKDQSGAVIHEALVQLVKDGKTQPAIQTNQKGEARIGRIAAGRYQLHVEAVGFKARDIEGEDLRPGSNRTEVTLEIDPIKADVEVSEEERVRNSDPNGPTFTNVMTAEQIAQLPDDPDELENAINQLAGPGAQMRVNGFRGGKLPPKSQIREIRFRLNPYAAENHDAGFGFVDIITKPGINSWHGSFNFGFRDEALAARQAFAKFRGPEQQRRFGLSLDGPLWKNHTSLFLNADGSLFYDAKTIVATLPTGQFSDLAFRPSRRLNLDARVEHALNKTHTSRFEYQRNAVLQNNLGVGDFDLLSRGFSQNQTEHILRLGDSGVLGKKIFNETRFQARWSDVEAQSVTSGQTILVPGSFNSGSAQRSGGRHLSEFEFDDNVDYAMKNHGLRFGIQAEAGSYSSNDSVNALGTFQFANLAAYQAGRPTQYTQRLGDPTVSYSQYQVGWYAQDDYRVRKDLTISLGLRQELQTNLGDKFNFAPRLGFVWAPRKGAITFRGGAGIFYDWFGSQVFEQTLRVNGQRQRDLVVTNPGYPNPLSGGTQQTLPASRIQGDLNMRNPYLVQASFGVETRPFNLVRLTTNYQYQRGVHLLRGRNLNAPIPGLGRPDPAVGNITDIESSGYSSAHRLTIGVGPAKFVNGFFWSANYLLMKNTNDGDSPFSFPIDNFNLRAERGPSPGDMRHFFSAFGSRKLIRGFSASAIINATSALPYNITTGFDNNGDTVINDRPLGVGRNSGRGAARWEVGTRLSWGKDFGPELKQTAGGGMQVKMVRIAGGGEGGAAAPSIGVGGTKRFRLELYAQAFNLFNHTNLGSFSGLQTSPFFGHATSAQLPRRLELGTRFNF
jgi:hypothetical protein